MPPADAPVCARTAAPARRGAKIVAALVSGQSVEAIADSEGLTRKQVETLLRDELRRRWVAPAADHARLQIVRLEAMAATLAPLAAAGETSAIDRVLRFSTGSTAITASTRPPRSAQTPIKAGASGCSPN